LLSSRLEKEAATEQSTLLGIRASSLGQEVRTLSGGNQQKVVLAKWILTNPKILLLDDPTRGVDIGAKAEIYAYMARLTARGTAILLISSELPELLLLSDRIIVLHRGSLTGEFPRAAATPERILAAAMGAGGVRGGQTP
jgi:ABC-type sugar transport system ATPase subunit